MKKERFASWWMENCKRSRNINNASMDMLEALQSLMLHFNRTELGADGKFHPAKIDKSFAAVRMAKKAISKALGELK
jgi:hypothetical protein